jgi:type II secretory pathway pseudopilin PulG
MKRMRNKAGFSLIEITIIIFIIAVLGIMVTGLVSRSRMLSRTMVCLNNLRQISMAIENYQADWKNNPEMLWNLYPYYLKDKLVFKCPEDKLTPVGTLPSPNSYSTYYINRVFYEDDPNKLFLYCPRHFSGNKGVGAFLSYASNILENKPVLWNETKIAPGARNIGGQYKFSDGTVVNVNSGLETGFIGSFTGPDDKIYSVICVPEGATGDLEVIHTGESRFEVVTPAIIAGVSGTRFVLHNEWNSSLNQATTNVSVSDGTVNVEDRAGGEKIKVNQGNQSSITVQCLSLSELNRQPIRNVPARPLRRIHTH